MKLTKKKIIELPIACLLMAQWVEHANFSKAFAFDTFEDHKKHSLCASLVNERNEENSLLAHLTDLQHFTEIYTLWSGASGGSWARKIELTSLAFYIADNFLLR